MGRKFATNKKSSRKGHTPKKLIIHHTAGGSNALAIRMLSGTLREGDKKVSSHYILLTTAELVGSVEEEYRAWTTGWEADKEAITVETVNSSGAPDWRVTDAQIAKLGRLAADLSMRYGWGRLTRENVDGHREYAATACPGPWIWSRLDSIIAHANRVRDRWIAYENQARPPETPEGGLVAIDELIKKIIRGELGNGQERIDNLRAMGFSDDAIRALAAEVTRRFNEIKEQEAAKPTTSDLIAIHKMIISVVRGEWGNGEERVRRLTEFGLTSDQIDALQAAVNDYMAKNR
jgi:hypothetical protein